MEPGFGRAPGRRAGAALRGANGTYVGPDGRLYGPLQAAGKFFSIDVDCCDATSDPWSDCDIRVMASGFHQPVSAKFDAHGVLHVQDLWAGELSTLDLVTGERTLVAKSGQGLDNLAFDATGRLFVTNADDGSVSEVLPGGAVRTLIPGGLITPGGVVVLERPGGGAPVLVADMHRLWEFDADTGSPIGFTGGDEFGRGHAARGCRVAALGPRILKPQRSAPLRNSATLVRLRFGVPVLGVAAKQ